MRSMLREGAPHDELVALIGETWARRDDRGAEQRLEIPQRGARYKIQELRQDPRREMHTRGG